jgi:hypothetical protein
MVTITVEFFLLESNKTSSEVALNALQSQISTLKNELALVKCNRPSEQDDFYTAMDQIEVSIHYIKTKVPISAAKSKPAPTPMRRNYIPGDI